ncbi:MAG: hypothetical protein FWF53_09520 [Candidatus Azobacteroides sp.]|nr:hypothetical protein [Candidatus Azobacteroides sp.]
MKTKGAVKTMLLVCCCIVFDISFSQTAEKNQFNEKLEPYIHFLKNEKPLSAKDYILSLFKNNDIVILCERDHREMTQYNLFLDIMSDPYFVNHVGVVFTEVGARNLNPGLDIFLQTEDLSKEEIDKQVLIFQRNCEFPLWEKPNFSNFIKGIHQINQSLRSDKKIQMYPTDILYVEGEETTDKYMGMLENAMVRDSLMADFIIDTFDQMKKDNPKSKALVIMNYRHAYRYDIAYDEGKMNINTGRFLFNKYPGRVANVRINGYNNIEKMEAVNDGKWDAAFQAVNLEDAGFNFNGSPFGDDRFEDWPYYKNDYTYKDMFTGFVFYMPIEKFELGMGVPYLMEDGFYDEYVKRDSLFNQALNKLRNVNDSIPSPDKNEIMKLNDTDISKLPTLDQVKASIQKWLE